MTDALAPAHAPSLRRRLLRWVTLTTVAILCLAAVLTYRQAREDVQELMDALMAETAQLLLTQASDGGNHVTDLPGRMATLHSTQPRASNLAIEFQIGRTDGTVLLRTAGAPDAPLAAPLGYADVDFEGHSWRTLIAESSNRAFRVQVALLDDIRDEEALEIATRAVLPLGISLPLLIAFIYLSVRRGLKPLDDLAGDVAFRSPENLSPLAADHAPAEVQPLIGALNRLLGRLAATLDNERRFTADAAHELRTPLAALKIHAQVALASAPAGNTREALGKVIAGVDRTTRLVEQLLRLARLDPLDHIAAPQPVDLGELTAVAVADARDAAGGRTITLLAPAGPLVVPGDPDLLGAALRNIIDNALRYTPLASTVTVSASATDWRPELEVHDDGPGVPPEELPRLTERFFRGSDPGAEGSGLGLAIVRRIAELHGASLEVANRQGGGLVVRLRWPPSLAATPTRST
ncbi:MAG: two-component sensor histidine kinase [Betaproteobacteria bacterium]|nr:two-component sensor histidine kinase [Betaproteobacteria bacterium]